MKKSIIKVLALGMLSMVLFTGCSAKEEEKVSQIDYTSTPEEILSNYSEEGMDVLRANFPDKMDMQIALKNIGRTPNNMKFKTIDGKDLTLENGKFKEIDKDKVMIEVVQASCTYCRENVPLVHKVLSEDKYKDIDLVTVFLNSTEEEVNNFYRDLNLEKPKYVLINEDKSLVNEFSLAVTPSSIYLDGNGKVSYIKNGIVDENTLKSIIDTAFSSKPIYDMVIPKESLMALF